MCEADCWLVSDSGTENKYPSVGFIFRISEVTLMLFSWLVKIRADFGSAQNNQLLDRFFRKDRIVSVDSRLDQTN